MLRVARAARRAPTLPRCKPSRLTRRVRLEWPSTPGHRVLRVPKVGRFGFSGARIPRISWTRTPS
jgi:hypothetical protein